jgi:hypothetical protein
VASDLTCCSLDYLVVAGGGGGGGATGAGGGAGGYIELHFLVEQN